MGYRVQLVLVISLGLLLRLYMAEKATYSIAPTYSSHIKSSLNFIWLNNEFKDDGAYWFDKGEAFNSFYKLRSAFDYKGLIDELAINNHPPLYYLILHTVKSFKSNGVSDLFDGYAINFVLSAFMMLVVLRLMNYLGISQQGKVLCLIVIGMNPSLLSVFLAHKGYQLQVVLSLLLLLHIFNFHKSEKSSRYHYILFGVICFSLYLTHYYGYIFVLMIGVWVFLTYFKKNFKVVLLHALACIIPAVIAFTLFPYMLDNITGDVHSLTIQERVTSPANSVELKDIKSAISLLAIDVFGLPVIVLSIFVLIGSLLIKPMREPKEDIFKVFWLGLIFSLITLLISPAVKVVYASIFTILLLLGTVVYIDRATFKEAKIFYLMLVFLFVGMSWQLSNYRVNGWHTRYAKLDGSVIIMTGEVREYLRPLIYHFDVDQLGILINETSQLDSLLVRNFTVLLDTKKRPEKVDKIKSQLEQHGYVKSERNFGNFNEYVRSTP